MTHSTRFARSGRAVLRNEKGQGTTEYIVLIILVSLVCIPVMTLLPKAVRGYVRPFYYCVSRPLP